MSTELVLQAIGVAFAVLLGLRAIVGRLPPSKPEAGQQRSPVAESLRASIGIRPLLRPSWNVDADEINRIGRIPVELNFDATVVTRAWHVLKSLLLRPSSSKPVFAVSETRLETAPLGITGTGGFELGGFVLTVVVASQDDSRHLHRSLESGPHRSARVVVDCTLEQYLSPSALLDCYCVDASAAHSPESARGELLLPSSDENRLGTDRTCQHTRDELPSDAIWLVRLQSQASDVTAHGEAIRRRSLFLDPLTTRAPRYGGYAVATVAVVWTLVAASRDLNASGSAEAEQALGAWSASLWPVFVLLGVPFCIWHWAQWRWERDDKSEWIARTTRCLSDGQDAQNGFARLRMRETRRTWRDGIKQRLAAFKRGRNPHQQQASLESPGKFFG